MAVTSKTNLHLRLTQDPRNTGMFNGLNLEISSSASEASSASEMHPVLAPPVEARQLAASAVVVAAAASTQLDVAAAASNQLVVAAVNSSQLDKSKSFKVIQFILMNYFNSTNLSVFLLARSPTTQRRV